MQDFLLDGSPHGDVASEFGEGGYDSGLYRPFLNKNGLKCVTLNMGKHYDPKLGRDKTQYETMTIRDARSRGYDAETLGVTNATILRKDEWIMFDRVVLEATRPRLRVWSDLAAANTYTLDGMSNEILEGETMNDPGEAMVDMSGIAEGRVDGPNYQLEGLPLPFTYMPFWFTERKLQISRKLGRPLSTMMASIAGRRVAETIEKTTLGTTAGVIYGTAANYSLAPQVFGYTNHPSRNTNASMTTPTGINPDVTVGEILAMRSTLYADGFFGPFVIYNGTDWDRYLDDDYYVLTTTGATAPTRTLRDRLRVIEDIRDVKRSDYLSPAETGGTFDMVMVSLSDPTVARAVIGMPIRVIQWPSQGGMRLNFKVMAIMAPQIRANQLNSSGTRNSGINHGSVT